MTTYRCELAWLPPGRVASDVRIVVSGGRIVSVDEDAASGKLPPETATLEERLRGLVLPGLANAHSHAFHRALRGRTQRPASSRGSFWSWREQMYAVAARLDPDTYLDLARATYGEMVLAGVTCVGEFHYLHHRPDGGAYDDPNSMGLALVQAAREAGLRIALLDT
ncbi:MAG: amidohydrolase family protein, partial [Solirubrobacterales bacterium]|nr:amidohydrolase family protein [Solirubrobacterales bacterium]